MEESGTTLKEDEICARMNGARDPTLPGKRGSDVTPKKVHWTWPDHIPRGAVVEYYGDPGNFKSGLAIDIAARMTTGKPFPLRPENTERKPAKVLFFSAEDDLETTLVPRFMAAGGDLESIHFVTATDKLPSLPDEEKVLRLYIKSWEPMFLVLDPWDAFLAPKLDPNSNPHARKALLPLIKLGSEKGLISWLIRHLNKDSKLGRAMYRSAGSIGTTAATRASYLVAAKSNEPNAFIFACTKINSGPKPRSIAYRLVEHHLDDHHITTQRIEWIGETDESDDDLVREPMPQNPWSSEKRELAEAFL